MIEPGVYLEISEATAYAGRPIQLAISRLDATGAGIGSRLAGPKFVLSGSRLLRRVRVDAAFVAEITPYLAAVTTGGSAASESEPS